MRIGIFTDTYPPFINGVSTSIMMLQRSLEKMGHEVFIVTVNDEKIAYRYENEQKIIRIPGIPIGIYDYRLTGIYPLKAINKIKKWNLDVIHSHTEFGVGTFARIIANQFNIPLVHTYHTMYEDYTHYITKGYFDGAGKKIIEYLTKFYCDKTITELIVPTQKAYDLFKQKYKVERNVYIIPTGIEVERFYKEKFKESEINQIRKNLGLSKDDFVILYVGRLAEEKSVDLLIDAQASLIKKHSTCKLLIVGDGPDINKYKKQAEKLKAADNVIFAGKIPWEEVPKYYQLASVFATASRTETQGLTVIEAMAASAPVICADDDSFKTVVVDDLNGYLFKNKRDYKNAVEKLISDQTLLKRLSKQARISSEMHSAKYFADRVLKVYEIAIDNKAKPKKITDKIKNTIEGVIHGKK